MNLHTVGFQNLRRLEPFPLEPEPSPGRKTAVESFWPQHWFPNPGGSYSLYGVKREVPFDRAFRLSDLSCCFPVSCVSSVAARWATLLQRSSQAEFQGRTGMATTCCKLSEGPHNPQQRSVVCKWGVEGPQVPKEGRYSGAKALGCCGSSCRWQLVHSALRMRSYERDSGNGSEIGRKGSGYVGIRRGWGVDEGRCPSSLQCNLVW